MAEEGLVTGVVSKAPALVVNSQFNSRTIVSLTFAWLLPWETIPHTGSKLVNGINILITHYLNDHNNNRGKNRNTKNIEWLLLLTLWTHFTWINLFNPHSNPVK